MLTGLQPQGTVDYNLEEEENQKEDWSILGLGGFVAEVLAGKWYQFNCQLNFFTVILIFFGNLVYKSFVSD